MRLYNGTKSSINLPLNNGMRLIVPPMSVSAQFMPSTEFLSMVVTAYTRENIAIIPSGAPEIQMCSTIATIPGYIAQSLDEAIMRFKSSIPTPNKECKVEAPANNTTEQKSSKKDTKSVNEVKDSENKDK